MNDFETPFFLLFGHSEQVAGQHDFFHNRHLPSIPILRELHLRIAQGDQANYFRIALICITDVTLNFCVLVLA